jgi:hypothetical protein
MNNKKIVIKYYVWNCASHVAVYIVNYYLLCIYCLIKLIEIPIIIS